MKAGSVNSNNSQQAVLTPNVHARDPVEISQDISKLLYTNLKLQQLINGERSFSCVWNNAKTQNDLRQ